MTFMFKLSRRTAGLRNGLLGFAPRAARLFVTISAAAGLTLATACDPSEQTEPSTQDAVEVTAPVAEATASVTITPGTNIQSKVNSYPAGTTFLLKAGTYYNQRVVPKAGNSFIGEAGTVLDGKNTTTYAFERGGSPYPNNVRIERITIQNYKPPEQQGAILAGGPQRDQNTTGWVIQNCEVRYNATGGIRIGNKTKVLNNFVHHNKQLGISGSGDSVLVEGNEISYNNYLKTYDFGIALGGGKFVNTRWLTVRGNKVHHNQGNGLWTDIGNKGALIENNIVDNNSGAGIMHEISYDAIIRNNTARGNGFARGWVTGAGILISASANVTVYGNTVKGNKQGIVGIQQKRNNQGVDYSSNLKNLYVHDNVVQVPAGGVSGISSISSMSFTGRGNRFVNNSYDLGTDNTPFNWMNGQKTKAQWQGYGQDVNGKFY